MTFIVKHLNLLVSIMTSVFIVFDGGKSWTWISGLMCKLLTIFLAATCSIWHVPILLKSDVMVMNVFKISVMFSLPPLSF